MTSRDSLWPVYLVLSVLPHQSNAQAYDSFAPEVIIDVSDTLQTQSPRLSRDADEVLHATVTGDWTGNGYGPMYLFSEDNGRTWSPAVFVVDSAEVKQSVATRPLVLGDEVYVVWQDVQNYFAGDVWLSTKPVTGHTFVPRVRVAEGLGSGLRDLIRTDSGRLVYYFIEEERPSYYYFHSVAWSDDEGGTWQSLPMPMNADHPGRSNTLIDAIVSGGNGALYVAISGEDGILWCYRSDDQGETWTGREVTDTGSSGACIAMSSDGTVVVAWEKNQAGEDIAGTIRISRSSDRGETWSSPATVVTEGLPGIYYRPIVASDGQGRWHISMLWNVPWTQTLDVYYTVSEDGGKTWVSPPVLISEVNGAAGWGHSLVVDVQGHVYAMWTKEFLWPEQHIVFRTNAPPRVPLTPNLLQPDDRVVLRMEQNPVGQQPVGLLYQLIEPGAVEAFIWDAQGRLVRRWHLGVTEAGEHRLIWDAHTENGEAVANGVYHWEIRVRTEDDSESVRTKAILLQ